MKANDLRNIGLAAYRSENDAVQHLLQNIDLTALNHTKIQTLARGWIETVRSNHTFSFLHHFLNKHQLNSSEGIALMGLAESLLRIPDNDTADALLTTVLHNKILTKISLPLVREGVRLLGAQFVLGEDLTTALEKTDKAYLYSFDMLGEAAKTQNDADRYFAAYQSAIQTVGEKQRGHISIKCSALHPRYQYTQIERLKKELVPRMIELCALAKQYKIAITIDAEEYDRLQLSLCLIDQILSSAELKNWDGFGLAIQSYQKAALPVIDVCEDLAKKYKHRIMLRLVKGAYWDSEIKRAQEQGLAQYPVFTRKITTDVNYLACAQRILKSPDIFYPQFATHNAYTIAAILQITGDDRDFEFQRLHGMGEQLYKVIMTQESIKCRVYAPVGDYQHLLAYLVRRLIENGANTSFVHQVEDQNTPIESLIEDPIATLRHLEPKSHPDIPIPPDLYGKQRKNPIAFDLSDLTTREQVVAAISRASSPLSQSSPRRRGSIFQRLSLILRDMDPRLRGDDVVAEITEDGAHALTIADIAFPTWVMQSVNRRANYLFKTADLLAEHQLEFISLLISEGKKTFFAAQSEVREAIDYCRYYAISAIKLMKNPKKLPGPTGEHNTLSLHARGICICISPWNFPLAIFLGQVVAALVTGNTVIAKPSSQTVQIAIRTIALLHQAGIPKDVLQIFIGKGSVLSEQILKDPRVGLVVFTGSLATAQHINRTLAARNSAIAALVAETGGQNAMIVDSSALLEQVVTDALTSAFDSAGQRCSALRILCIQDEIYDDCVEMLRGAMAQLSIGDPSLLSTDIGPVIDGDSQSVLNQYIEQMKVKAKLIYQLSIPDHIASQDTFVAPCAFEIEDISLLDHEVFGPILHVYRYKRQRLPELIAALNATGYGLTLGIHSRIEPFVQQIVDHTFVGNNYVNRNMIGAVVGVQPFGGQNFSGTGPKAGGPNYLLRLVSEKTLTINTAAVGGNVTLLSQVI